MKQTNISTLLVATRFSLMTLTAITVLTACTCSGANALENTAWELESLNENTPLLGTTITIEFGVDQISGSAGCNHYGGGYKASGNNLSIGDLFATEMACLEPEGVLEQEQAYLAALGSADRYQIDNDRLEIFDETGTQILVFVTPNSAAAMTTPTATANVTAMTTSAPVEATPLPTLGPPAGFQQHRDSETGVSLYPRKLDKKSSCNPANPT